MASAPVSIAPLGATLGEGPMWDVATQTLWCVDIKRHLVFRFDPATEALSSWTAPGEVGWVLPRAGGGMVVGVQSGLYGFGPAEGRFTPLIDPEPHMPGNRLNDATTDAAGRIWFGSMDNGEQAESGRLYRHDHRGCADAGLAPVAITNGPAISPDGTTLYHTDTLGRTVWQVPIRDDGTLGDPTPFVEIAAGEGHPDGSTTDAEGGVWVALFGGWGVRHYDPAGTLIETVRFPVANITKIAFGGADLRTAYATTARKGLSAAQLAEQPEAGNLFAFDPGVTGMATHSAKI
ncbi:SMP-30/gluconolactonase/LRE family protein [Sphingomonas sp. DC1600-2]|uniref:SMP-30/gluconolactonase/LRE family protein n=2 Tax=Pseudomonadota TaxID=1224 RepID=UPI003CF9FD84